jgi:hypothetical protein
LARSSLSKDAGRVMQPSLPGHWFRSAMSSFGLGGFSLAGCDGDGFPWRLERVFRRVY